MATAQAGPPVLQLPTLAPAIDDREREGRLMTTRTHRSSLEVQLGRAGAYYKMAATLRRPLNLNLSASKVPPVALMSVPALYGHRVAEVVRV